MKTRLKALLCLAIGLALLLLPTALADAQPERVVLSVQEEALTFDLSKTRSVSLSARVEPADASQRVTWASSNSSVARVSSSGKVSFRGRGTVTITATSKADPAKKGTCTVKVSGDQTDIDFGDYGPEENW